LTETFTQKFLRYGAGSSLLASPPFYDLFSPLRAGARLVYSLGVIVLAPTGALYHLSVAAIRYGQAHYQTEFDPRAAHVEQAIAHYKAFEVDFSSPLNILGGVGYAANLVAIGVFLYMGLWTTAWMHALPPLVYFLSFQRLFPPLLPLQYAGNPDFTGRSL